MEKLPDKFFDLVCCEDVQKLCRPFMRQHGLSTINYTRVYWNFKVAGTSTNEAWTRFYYEHQLYNYTKGFPNIATNHIIYLDDIDRNAPIIKDHVRYAEELFDFAHAILVFSIRIGYIDIFTFGFPRIRENTKAYFIENKLHFSEFMNYYRNNIRTVIKQVKKFGLIAPIPKDWTQRDKVMLAASLTGDITNNTELVKELTINSLSKDVDLKINRFYLDEPFDDIYLTPKEYMVIKLLKNGMSFKSIARITENSWTTVRAHVDRIRKKFGCDSRYQLLDFINDNYIIEMLDDTLPLKMPYQEVEKHKAFREYLSRNPIDPTWRKLLDDWRYKYEGQRKEKNDQLSGRDHEVTS